MLLAFSWHCHSYRVLLSRHSLRETKLPTAIARPPLSTGLVSVPASNQRCHHVNSWDFDSGTVKPKKPLSASAPLPQKFLVSWPTSPSEQDLHLDAVTCSGDVLGWGSCDPPTGSLSNYQILRPSSVTTVGVTMMTAPVVPRLLELDQQRRPTPF